ncbi:MAG TPA: glycosyltransferase family 4 protein [Chloroflexota bacterium]|nr:glycosyltransferase family 4 protein [Chloroflexota bacterium]
MVAPLYERIPPARYGGTERVVSYLVEELVRRGHDVTLFATGDSKTAAKLIGICPEGLNAAARLADPVAYHFLQLGLVFQRAGEFDLIHSHCDFRALPFASFTSVPLLSTSHNRLDSPEAHALVATYPQSMISVLSESQRRQLPVGRCIGVTYNGIPVDEFHFEPTSGEYLAFVGRLSPEKGPLDAIEVAEQSGIPLKLAGRINHWEREYFETQLRPRIRPPLIEFIGELDEQEKRDFLGRAKALLFPIKWPEPFGLTLVEAMATGTPVLAFPHGAVPELVKPGVSGYLCPDADAMVQRVNDLDRLDRQACRDWVAQHFSVQAMVDRYETIYQQVAISRVSKVTGACAPPNQSSHSKRRQR